jgi:uncharacterized RDD family membrane protein YckC
LTLIMTADVPDPATQRTLAGRGPRLGAVLIDACLFEARALMPSPFGLVWVLLVTAVNLWGLLMHGQTIGKCLLKITIVDPETNLPPGYFRLVIRSAPLVVLSRLLPVASLVYVVVDGLFIFSPTRRCLHDRFARTVVIGGTREWWQRKHQVDELAVS